MIPILEDVPRSYTIAEAIKVMNTDSTDKVDCMRFIFAKDLNGHSFYLADTTKIYSIGGEWMNVDSFKNPSWIWVRLIPHPKSGSFVTPNGYGTSWEKRSDAIKDVLDAGWNVHATTRLELLKEDLI